MVVRDGGEVRASPTAARTAAARSATARSPTAASPARGTAAASGSTDGSVERGPAAYPQPALDVRVSGGMVEVRDRAAVAS